MTTLDGESYPENVVLDTEVERPRYDNAMHLLTENGGGKAALLDYWARGNYTRRVLYLRQLGIRPLLVRVSSVDQMRWAHRRLSLIGLPVDFIYSGPLAAAVKGVMVVRLPKDHVWDAGWGYIATQWSHRGRFAAALFGTARLMPESVVEWLVEEAADDFRDGNVFVAPAPLIGLGSADGSLAPLATIVDGSTIDAGTAAATGVMELDIPFLDQMTPRAFNKFVRNHAEDLSRFRLAFGRLVSTSPENAEQFRDWISELKAEVADIQLSDRFSRLRRNLSAAGGALGAFTACAGAVGATPVSLSMVGAGAAGAALIDLWKQAVDRRQARAESRLSLLWSLGLQRPSHVRRARRVPRVPANSSVSRAEIQPPLSHHWLCPPRHGIRFARVRKHTP